MANITNIMHIAPPTRSVAKAPQQEESTAAKPSVEEIVPPESVQVVSPPGRQEVAAPGNQVPPEKEEKDVSIEEQMSEIAKEMKEYVQHLARDLEFNVDKDSGRVVITVIDPETDKIVRQIPPEETLHVLRTMQNGGGSLFEDKV
jgi:flagellar protein FlaG